MTKMSPLQIKNFRKQTGLSQKAFAQAVNLPIRTYRSYESGERGLTIDKFRELKEKLGYYQECHKNNLRAHIDYLRLTFPSIRDLEAFCENFLFCHLSEFTDQETRLRIIPTCGNGETFGFSISLISLRPMTIKRVSNSLVKVVGKWNSS